MFDLQVPQWTNFFLLPNIPPWPNEEQFSFDMLVIDYLGLVWVREGDKLENHAKCLGIVIDKNLKWTQHVKTITAKANSVRGLLQRNLAKCPVTVKCHCYNTFVHPILEYACTVWSPYQEQNIHKIEMV